MTLSPQALCLYRNQALEGLIECLHWKGMLFVKIPGNLSLNSYLTHVASFSLTSPNQVLQFLSGAQERH